MLIQFPPEVHPVHSGNLNTETTWTSRWNWLRPHPSLRNILKWHLGISTGVAMEKKEEAMMKKGMMQRATKKKSTVFVRTCKEFLYSSFLRTECKSTFEEIEGDVNITFLGERRESMTTTTVVSLGVTNRRTQDSGTDTVGNGTQQATPKTSTET